jgi:hypothetical protein
MEENDSPDIIIDQRDLEILNKIVKPRDPFFPQNPLSPQVLDWLQKWKAATTGKARARLGLQLKNAIAPTRPDLKRGNREVLDQIQKQRQQRQLNTQLKANLRDHSG